MKIPEIRIHNDNAYDKLYLRNENVAYTHNGPFHADDVCCGALLKMVFPDIEIRRVENLPPDAELAFDIGEGKYDHHGLNPPKRENGVEYSSFGLLWPDLGPLIIPQRFISEFDYGMVAKIDYSDTTGKSNPLTSTIRAMNPYWNDTRTADECYEEAVKFVMGLFRIHFDNFLNREKGYVEVENYMRDPNNLIGKRTLVLPKYIPFKCAVQGTDIYYVVYPNQRSEGYYTIALVSPLGKKAREEGRRGSRKQRFPPQWFSDKPAGCEYISDDIAVADSMVSVKYIVSKLECYVDGF